MDKRTSKLPYVLKLHVKDDTILCYMNVTDSAKLIWSEQNNLHFKYF
jgi:hypothetical protein